MAVGSGVVLADVDRRVRGVIHPEKEDATPLPDQAVQGAVLAESPAVQVVLDQAFRVGTDGGRRVGRVEVPYRPGEPPGGFRRPRSARVTSPDSFTRLH